MSVKKKIGLSRSGTGKISTEEQSSSQKWTNSIKSQLETGTQQKKLLAKLIPVDYVLTDPENPRRLKITKDEVSDVSKIYPMNREAIQADNPDEWLEGYIQQLTTGTGFTGKKLGDLISIVEFAAGLKSAKRLLHPISTIQEETTFHLVAGERRLLAHIMLGESHIKATISTEAFNRSEIDTLQWEENVHREGMSLFEKVDRVKKIIEATDSINGTSVTKLSKRIGRGRAEAQRYLAVIRCRHAALMCGIEDGKVSDLKKAAALAQLTAKDIECAISGKKVATPKPAVKISKNVNIQGLRSVVEIAGKTLKGNKFLKEYDLNNLNDLSLALEELIHSVGENPNA